MAATARTPRNFRRIGAHITRRNDASSAAHVQRKTKILFALHSTSQISIKADYNETLLPALRNIENVSWDNEHSKWMIPATIAAYTRAMRSLPLQTPNLNIELEPLPPTIVQLMKEEASIEDTREVREANVAELLCRIQPSALWGSLKSFQKTGVCEGLNRNGRLLLGDEMGLGKTVQALAIALAYSDEWPVLVVCPSSLRLTWKAEIMKWLQLSDDEIHVSLKSSDLFKKPQVGEKRTSTSIAGPRKRTAASAGPRRTQSASDTQEESLQALGKAKFYVISYELAMKNSIAIANQQFKFVICDESHYIKNRLAKRTHKMIPIVQKAKRALLLSGTPVLSRPAELFSQLNALRPDLFADFERFGASNLAELKYAMEMSVFVQRLKKDVSLELPEKIRQPVLVDISAKDKSEMKKMLNDLKKLDNKLNDGRASMREKRQAKETKQQLMNELFVKSGTAKIPAVTDFADVLFQKSHTSKVIIFAYHANMMDAVVDHAKKHNIEFIRIDGRTDRQTRQTVCEKFQTEARVRLAIVSITAANIGLTLSAADTVLFAELFWNPSQLLQAEDRAHRIGRVGPMEIKYILALDTIDSYQWRLVKRKLKIVGEALDGSKTQVTLDTVEEEDERGTNDFLNSIGANVTCDTDDDSSSESDLEIDEDILAELTEAANLVEREIDQEPGTETTEIDEENTSPTTPTPSNTTADIAPSTE
ncbi:hypothetical protein DFQ28_010184 [Apophysomyces sp. BC1034]|nr:hypothetical protein DFQ28_010184 [Apophysomyces sp. BC1034]